MRDGDETLRSVRGGCSAEDESRNGNSRQFLQTHSLVCNVLKFETWILTKREKTFAYGAKCHGKVDIANVAKRSHVEGENQR